MPTRPRVSPKNRLARPRVTDEPSTAETAAKATSIRQKYSAGPKVRAKSTTRGAKKASAAVASVPATKEPIAAVARAAEPRPARAMRLPSSAVTTDELSPGVFIRIEVVDEPYMAP